VITRGVAPNLAEPLRMLISRGAPHWQSGRLLMGYNIQKGFFIVYVNLNFLGKKFLFSLFRIQNFVLVRTRILGFVSSVADPHHIERIQIRILLLTLIRIRIRFSIWI
jgi:hypothetical protein